MKDYKINISDEYLVVSCPDMDDIEIALDGNKVADAYVVQFLETQIGDEPGYMKTTRKNGIEDFISVEKSRLRPDDMITTLEMGKDYLFMAVYKDEDEVTTPYYIKLPES